jgi:hypothetical protein
MSIFFFFLLSVTRAAESLFDPVFPHMQLLNFPRIGPHSFRTPVACTALQWRFEINISGDGNSVPTPFCPGPLHAVKLTAHYVCTVYTIPNQWPPLASEVSANFFADRGVSRGQRDGSLRSYSRLSRPEPLLFLPSSSSIILTRLSGPRSRPTTSEKIW